MQRSTKAGALALAFLSSAKVRVVVNVEKLYGERTRGGSRPNHQRLVWKICRKGVRLAGIEMGLCRRGDGDRCLGGDGPNLSLLRHLAAGDQYRHNHRDLPDGIS